MLNLEIRTKLTEEDVINRLKKFFGEGGLGLALMEEGPQCLTFEGGGGHVTVTLCRENGKTRLTLVSQEWDYQVKRFVTGLP